MPKSSDLTILALLSMPDAIQSNHTTPSAWAQTNDWTAPSSYMFIVLLAVQQSLCYMYHLLSHSRASVAEFFALVVPSAISLLTIFFRVWKRSGPLSNFFWSFCKKKTLIHTMYTITILFRAIPTCDSSQPCP